MESEPMDGHDRGKPPWRSWLKWSMAIVTIGVATGLILPLFQTDRSHVYANCQSNLHQIALACLSYSEDYDRQMPAFLDCLTPDYIRSARVLRCPAVKGRGLHSYVIVPGIDADMPDDFVVAYESSLENHSMPGRNVAFLDGHVEWWPAAREAEFQRCLAEQGKKIQDWKPTSGAHR